MTDGLRPQLNWGEAARQFAEETGHQTLLCVTCVSQGNVSPPPQIVILGGASYCLPHSNLIKLGPVT